MCRRYALAEMVAVEREFLPTQVWWSFDARSNVAPGQYVPAIRMHDGFAEGVMMRWGLIPAWSEGKPLAEPTHQADIADLQSHAYSMPWLNGQRCILPMAGFYVWQLTTQQHRQPHFVYLKDRGTFGVAAIWDRSVLDKDDVIESCALLRAPANDLLVGVDDLVPQASPGMPAILRRRDYDRWLRGTPAEAATLIQSYRAAWMSRHAVSPRINALAHDDPGLRLPA
jgi:putative SOS response-associated peptidase YedK